MLLASVTYQPSHPFGDANIKLKEKMDNAVKPTRKFYGDETTKRKQRRQFSLRKYG